MHPARNGMALGASLRARDLNWPERHAFWAALTLIAPPRAREGRGGADRRAYVADLFFLLSLVRRGMALGRWQLPLLRRRLLLRWVARYGVRIRVHPARNGMALGASLRARDLNWLARHAFWAALTLIAPPRAREGRGGADRRAYVADLFFLLSLVRRGMALGRWQLPLLRRRLLLRWVARYGVRIRVHPARNGMALGASLRARDLNWLARHAFWAALTLIAPPRAREGRGGADNKGKQGDC